VKYRAVLIDPGNANQERPVQILTNSMDDVKRWAYGLEAGNDGESARGVLPGAVSDQAAVNVYAVQERLLDILTKKGKPA